MFNSKKLALSGLCLAGVMAAGSAVAVPEATVTWGGTVPGTTVANGIVITGLNGNTDPAALRKTILPTSDGKFVGAPIILEAYDEHSTNAGEPDLTSAASGVWTLVSTNVVYGGAVMPGTTSSVTLVDTAGTASDVANAVAGSVMGTSSAPVHSISVAIEQTAALTGVQGKVVQAAVTMDYTDV